MKLFQAMYTRVMRWSRHPKAPWYLGGLSFAESSFFLIPPDVMLAPMCLAQPTKAYRFAALTTLMSVLGGIFGYLIGAWAFEVIEPQLMEWGYGDAYESARAWFDQWGVLAIFVAGFSPIPYKIFTIAAGSLSMAFLPFVLASAVGRGARFFLVAAMMAWGGAKAEAILHKYVDALGWLVIAAGLITIWVFN